MGEVKQEHASANADKIRSEFPSVSFTSTYIDDAWDLVNLVLSCSKKLRTTIRTIEGFVIDYDRKGRVVAGVMDCEPSMVKAGRTLTDSGVL